MNVFLIITFISEYKNDSNTQKFEVNKNTFIDKLQQLRNV